MMAPENLDASLITDVNVKEYFRNSLETALSNQRVDAGEDTVYYIVNLLAYFTRADKLFACTDEGVTLQPLALIYAEAVESASAEERHQILRRLGDVALLISGLFSSSLNRKLVDIDYYIAMGGTAYGYLCDLNRGTLRGKAFCAIFGELSEKFQVFVDVLSEVGERTPMNSCTDIMRLYEIWLRTGSRRAADKLRKLGIEPAQGSISRRNN
ncbi:hypothetical protein ACWJKU_05075 [Methylocaldum sp. MU1018]|jgi:hypothetical protein